MCHDLFVLNRVIYLRSLNCRDAAVPVLTLIIGANLLKGNKGLNLSKAEISTKKSSL